MSADPGVPGWFRIRPTISQPDLYRFTATIGSVPTGTIAYGSYEPFVFGTKWELTGDVPNELVADRGGWRVIASKSRMSIPISTGDSTCAWRAGRVKKDRRRSRGGDMLLSGKRSGNTPANNTYTISLTVSATSPN